jgi:hypothetical protein
MSLATCPNDPSHDRFATSAHVAQLWQVNRSGAFEQLLDECTDVTHAPESGNLWECLVCADDPACPDPVYAVVE